MIGNNRDDHKQREPRLEAGSWDTSVLFFGRDVQALMPGDVFVIDENVLGYPPKA